MMHTFAGFMVAAAAGAASFWGVLTHPIVPHATSTWPMASTTRPGFATSSMPMRPPFMNGSSTPSDDDGWRNASSSLEHMPRPIPPFMGRHYASSTASTTWGMGSTTRPHPMPRMASTSDDESATSTPRMPMHTESGASTSAPAASGGFWQSLFRLF